MRQLSGAVTSAITVYVVSHFTLVNHKITVLSGGICRQQWAIPVWSEFLRKPIVANWKCMATYIWANIESIKDFGLCVSEVC